MGGLGLPNLKTYHTAVTLDQVKHWWHKTADKNWPLMEIEMIGKMDLKAIFLDPIGISQPPHYFPPAVLVTYQYWKSMLSETSSHLSTSQVPVPLDFLELTHP